MSEFLKRYWFIVIPVLVSAVYLCYVSWLIWPWLGVDTVSYFKVAEYYAAFDFDKAVNGYWSPLLSWMLVPAVWLGIDLTLALRLVHVLAVLIAMGLVAWACVRYIGRSPTVIYRKWALCSLLMAMGVTLSFWAARSATPDLIAAFVFVIVLLLAHRLGRVMSMKLAIGLGVAMALLFFAKSIGFFISGAVMVGLFVAAARHGTLSRVSKYLAVSLGLFLLLSAAWSGAIYLKYGTVSLSSASANNFALIGPEAKKKHQIDYTNTVLPLPYDDSVTPWDDPTNLSPRPWSLSGNMSFYANHIVSNVGLALVILTTTSFVAVLGGYYLYRSRSKSSAGLRWALATVTLTTVILYSALLVEERYMYVILVPLLLCAPLGYARLWQKKKSRRTDSVVAAVGFLSICIIAVQTVSLWQPAQYMHSFSRIQHAAVGVVPAGSRVAVQSLDFMQTCYYWGVQCPALNYKLADDSMLSSALIDELVANDISYYVTRTPAESDRLRPVYVNSLPAKATCLSLSHGVHACGAAHMLVYEVVGSQ